MHVVVQTRVSMSRTSHAAPVMAIRRSIFGRLGVRPSIHQGLGLGGRPVGGIVKAGQLQLPMLLQEGVSSWSVGTWLIAPNR